MSIDSAVNDTRKKNVRKRQHQDPPKKMDEGLRRKAHPKIKHTVMPQKKWRVIENWFSFDKYPSVGCSSNPKHIFLTTGGVLITTHGLSLNKVLLIKTIYKLSEFGEHQLEVVFCFHWAIPARTPFRRSIPASLLSNALWSESYCLGLSSSWRLTPGVFYTSI